MNTFFIMWQVDRSDLNWRAWTWDIIICAILSLLPSMQEFYLLGKEVESMLYPNSKTPIGAF